MKSRTLSFSFLTLCAALASACVTSHYDGDDLGVPESIGGLAYDPGSIEVFVWNNTQSQWDAVGTTVAVNTVALSYQGDTLHNWTWPVPTSLPPAYLDTDNDARFRFVQNGSALRVSTRGSNNTANPNAISPAHCVSSHLANFNSPQDWGFSGGFYINNPTVFTECGGTAGSVLTIHMP